MSEVSSFKMRVGSKIQVWREIAQHTKSGQTKSMLIKNKRGKIVSRAKHEQGKLRYKENGLKPKTSEEMKKLRDLKSK